MSRESGFHQGALPERAEKHKLQRAISGMPRSTVVGYSGSRKSWLKVRGRQPPFWGFHFSVACVSLISALSDAGLVVEQAIMHYD